MTPQPGKQTIGISKLPNMSGSKGNQTMKIDQLIEYNNTKSIFLEKSSIKCGEEAIPWPFSKKSNLSISLNQWSKVLCSLLLLYDKLRAIETF